jgi:hypothetical protein
MAQKMCLQCGSIGDTKRSMKGSVLTELFLWLFFLLPGLIYSIWRHSTVAQVCSKCESSNVIPLDSPVAQNILANQPKARSQVRPDAPTAPQPVSMSPKKALVIVGVSAVVVIILFASLGGTKGEPATAAAPPVTVAPAHMTATQRAAASAAPGGEAARLIALCGKPDKDFTKNEGGQPSRHLIYKKQNVELMYSHWNVPAWELVGIFEINADETMETAEANRRLPCAAGSIHTVLDKP